LLIQTAERAHARHLNEVQAYWPRNALDLWWRRAKRSPCRERAALDVLDDWRRYATERGSRLSRPDLNFFLDASGGQEYARTFDRMSVSSLLATSSYRLLRGNYAGAAFTAMRLSDSNSYAVGLRGGTIEVEGLIAHAAASVDGVLHAHDQSGLGNDLSSGGGALRPRIVNAGVLDTTDSGAPSFRFDGSNDALYRASLLGLTGSPALSVCFVVKYFSYGGYVFALGSGSTGPCFRPAAVLANEAYIDTNASNRRFSAASFSTAHRVCIAGKAAGATVGAWTFRQDGTDLVQTTVSGGGTALNLSGAHCCWGHVRNSSGVATGWGNLSSNFLAVFNAVLADDDLLLIEQEMARHV
jgi:hypothetical protein